MARLRVFVSSTYYDLKHMRSSLQQLIEELGHEAILFERGDVAFTPEQALDRSCYAEIELADIVVLIIGGRYGQRQSDQPNSSPTDDLSQFDSITKGEHDTARKKGVPVYTLIDKSVYTEYQTYKRNIDKPNIEYAHVDSKEIFRFIYEIESLDLGNPVYQFEKFSDIEFWLKDQWSGLFRDSLIRRKSSIEMQEVNQSVERLTSVVGTLEKYLESLLKRSDPETANRLIEEERISRQEAATVYLHRLFATQPILRRILASTGLAPEELHGLLAKDTPEDLAKLLLDNRVYLPAVQVEELFFEFKRAQAIAGLPSWRQGDFAVAFTPYILQKAKFRDL